MVTVSIKPRKIFYGMILLVLLLVVLHLTVTLIPTLSEKKKLYYFFNLDFEHNLPTFFSSMNLLLSSVLLLLISYLTCKENRNEYKYWLSLSVIFSFLALDEFTIIHEIVGLKVQRAFDTEGYFFFAWVIPYSFVVLLLFVVYLKFLMKLPKKTALQFLIAGCMFVMGAMGVEMITANHVYAEGVHNLSYNLLSVVEETLEMTGIIVFIKALLEYIKLKWPVLSFQVGSETQR